MNSDAGGAARGFANGDGADAASGFANREDAGAASSQTAPGFAERVIAWQSAFGRRDLPWQSSPADPYRTWVSEIMLQQTRVSTVVPYFERFVAAFPDVAALASASLERVLEHWSGLGYYSRARNLHRAAGVVVERHGGIVPAALPLLADLPGVGRSTAAAVCALAYGKRAAILDGNVKRVVARHRGVEGFPGDRVVERRLWAEAEALLPDSPTTIGPYTQGMMDLGATVCTRSSPACGRCPVGADCVALRRGLIQSIPAPRPKRALPHHEITVLVLEAGGEVLLERRPPAGVWGGLWSLPELFAVGADRLSDAEIVGACVARFEQQVCRDPVGDAAASVPGQFVVRERIPPIRHAFTHFTLDLHPIRVRLGGDAANRRMLRKAAEAAGGLWLGRAEFGNAALPAPVKRLLASLAVG